MNKHSLWDKKNIMTHTQTYRYCLFWTQRVLTVLKYIYTIKKNLYIYSVNNFISYSMWDITLYIFLIQSNPIPSDPSNVSLNMLFYFFFLDSSITWFQLKFDKKSILVKLKLDNLSSIRHLSSSSLNHVFFPFILKHNSISTRVWQKNCLG